jgi:nucleoside-diphosphate-sugar epimerase
VGGTVPTLTQSIADPAAAAGARLVYADNLYAYGPVDGPITEDLPAQATTNKGRIRALMAERLLAAHHSGTLQVAIGRSSDYYGPGGANRVVATSCSARPSTADEPAGWAAWTCRTA